MLWFVAQTGVLYNTIAERVDADPLSSWYLDEAYSMANHMLVVSRCFVSRTTKAAHISTPHLKNILGKISRQIRDEPVAFQAHPHSSDVSQ